MGLTRIAPLLCAAVMLAGPVAMGQDFDKVEITTTDLGDGLYMMMGQGGNLGLSVGDDGTFLIDDQYAPLSAKIQTAIAAVTDTPATYVINTHWHGDHTGGNENFGKAGAVIVAHDNVRKRMSVEQVMKAFNRNVPASPEDALPVITFSETVTFHFNGQAVMAVHMPNAHTDGDAVIKFEDSNVLHTGDLFFNGLFPFIDFGSGGNINGVIEAQEAILNMTDDATKIIPGHGPLATKADLAATRQKLIKIRDTIKPLMDEGLSMEEIVAKKPLTGLDLGWPPGFLTEDQFVQTVVAGLAAQK